MVCAAPLARRAPDLATALIDDGWQVTVVATPPGHQGQLDGRRIEEVTGSASVRDYRKPEEPKRGGELDQVVVCPLRMNTVANSRSGSWTTMRSACCLSKPNLNDHVDGQTLVRAAACPIARDAGGIMIQQG